MFAKVFAQILDSSITDNPELRFTFMDMLVLADINGVVDMTHEAIARRTNRPLAVIRKTISELEGPDARSRTPDCGGARIKRLDDHREWGWLIINYQRFRELASEEQRRAATRERVARHREKIKAEGNAEEEGGALLCVTEALHERRTQGQLLSVFLSENLPPPLNTLEMRDAWDEWQEHCRQRRNKLSEGAALKQIKRMQEWGPGRAVAAIQHSIEKNWKSIYEAKDDQNGHRPTKGKVDYSAVTEENAV